MKFLKSRLIGQNEHFPENWNLDFLVYLHNHPGVRRFLVECSFSFIDHLPYYARKFYLNDEISVPLGMLLLIDYLVPRFMSIYLM